MGEIASGAKYRIDENLKTSKFESTNSRIVNISNV